ncbi:hypothetical protein ACN2XU_16970 [Primorskyibacter sp. 2E107]|uniref:hypothetical protein n=1 Tax=Primorskyibacter sp. 2E107 TaxID=3403458 RepID=UPI003AF93204
MRGLAVILTLMALPALAGPYDGLYQPQGANWNCRDIGQDGGAISVQGDTFEGVESRCKLQNPTAVRGMNATLYDAECNGEGMSYGYRMMLMSSPPGLTVISEGYAAYLEPCE